MTPPEPCLKLGGWVNSDNASIHRPNSVRVCKPAALKLLAQREEVIALEYTPTGIAELVLYRSEELLIRFSAQVATPSLETRLWRIVVHVRTA
jgi:hypothetical protein